jgi:lipoteichoic acid synthase
MIIHMPGQTAGTVVPDAAGQVDVAPTMADALGLDTSSTPLFGRDLFVRSRILLGAGRIVPVGSYFDERVLFVPGTGFKDGYTFDIATKQPGGVEAASEEKWQRIRETIRLSESYALSLPKRKNYQKDEGSVIPQLPQQ